MRYIIQQTVRITNALSETVRFDNCCIFKSHVVEPRLSLNLHCSVLELYLQQIGPNGENRTECTK